MRMNKVNDAKDTSAEIILQGIQDILAGSGNADDSVWSLTVRASDIQLENNEGKRWTGMREVIQKLCELSR